MPRADEYYLVRQDEGKPLVLNDLRQLNGRSGFVVAPFAASKECPIVVIEQKKPPTSQPLPDLSPSPSPIGRGALDESDMSLQRIPIPAERVSTSLPYMEGQGEVSLYPFTRFHDALLDGHFQKLVLARSESLEVSSSLMGEDNGLSLFLEACHRYPRMFVTLFSTPQTGTWLMATPEVLIQKSERFSTMALAGTMKLEGEQLKFDNPDRSGVQDIRWSQKNIQEQRLVATYIADTLKDFADDITEQGPYTTRAANLVHLRSDFTFVPKQGVGIGDMVKALHPTPAVCGLPKAEAQAFILKNEPAPRRYYSGFCGPVELDGRTDLFVSLRCMELSSHSCRLYAGGGLLTDSVEEQEWQETEAKMMTMRQLIVCGDAASEK